MKEADLTAIRLALEEPSLKKALDAMEHTLEELGYVKWREVTQWFSAQYCAQFMEGVLKEVK